VRILIIIPKLTLGGAESVVNILAREWIAGGHEVSVLVENQADLENIQVSPDRINYLHLSVENVKLRAIPHLVTKWYRQHNELFETFDVIHVHLTRAMVVGLILKFVSKIKRQKSGRFVTTIHSIGGKIGTLRRIFEILSSIFFEEIVLVAPDSTWNRYSKIFPRLQFSIIPNGIPVNSFKTPCSTSKKPIKEITIGTISRLSPDRNPQIFLELTRKLKDTKDLKFKFFLYGDGILLNNLQRYVSEHDLENDVELIGNKMNKSDFLDTLNLYITLSTGTMPGVAGLESIRQGVPILGIQLQSDFTPVYSDWVYSTGELNELATKIRSLYHNPQSLKNIIDGQFDILTKFFNSQRMADDYLTIFNKTSPLSNTRNNDNAFVTPDLKGIVRR